MAFFTGASSAAVTIVKMGLWWRLNYWVLGHGNNIPLRRHPGEPWVKGTADGLGDSGH
jgi:hypothetical protein